MSTVIVKPMTKRDVADLVGVSIRTLENWIAQGLMPAPCRLGARRVYWLPPVIAAWVEERLGGSVPRRRSPGRPRGKI